MTTWQQIKRRRHEIYSKVIGALFLVPLSCYIIRLRSLRRGDPGAMMSDDSQYYFFTTAMTFFGVMMALAWVPREVVADRLYYGRRVGFGWRLLLAWEGWSAVIWAIGIVIAIPIAMIFILAAFD